MKLRVFAFIAWSLAASSVLFGQATQATKTIEKTELSGIPEDRLSAALRGDIQKLAGQSYDEKIAGQMAERIQTELPEYVATSTTAPGSQADRINLVFVVAHNVNSKYFVEAVELRGTDKSKLTDALWADLQKMVGHPVDDDEADRMKDLIGVELKFNHIRRSVVRGNQPQHVRLIYEKANDNSIGFDFSAGYHSRQKFSGRLGLAYTKFDMTGIRIDLYNNNDQLTERFAGPRYAYWIEYKRVRFNIEYSSFKAKWSPETLFAATNSSQTPGLYRLRDTIEPSAKLTITPAVHVTLGVASSQIQLQSPALHFESVRTAKGKFEYAFQTAWSEAQRVSGSYELNVAGDTLGSAESYTRHLWNQYYSLREDSEGVPLAWISWSRLSASLRFGRITGHAPLYERFSMGSATTLVGWNKSDIAPLGASRTAYGSLTMSNRYGSAFFESGALWDNGQPKVLRKSVGFNVLLGNVFHAPEPLRFILNILRPGMGIPIRGSNVRPMFTFGGSGS